MSIYVNFLATNFSRLINDETSFCSSYRNSKLGRQDLAVEQPGHIVAQIMEVWGDTPTVEDYIPENLPQSPPSPTTVERIIAAQQTITSLDLALIAAEQSITDNDLRLLALEAAA